MHQTQIWFLVKKIMTYEDVTPLSLKASRSGMGFYRRYREEPSLSSIWENLRDGWEGVKNKCQMSNIKVQMKSKAPITKL